MTTLEMSVEIRGAAQREKYFTELYENAFPRVAEFVSHRRGTLQDAKDIFHDALVIFYEKTVNGKLETIISDEAYILGIAKHLWIRRFKDESKNVSLDELESGICLPEDYLQQSTHSENSIINLLERAGKKCMELLTAFYYHNYSIKEIAKAFNYGSERSATVQKYKCLEKVRDTVKEKSLDHESFIE